MRDICSILVQKGKTLEVEIAAIITGTTAFTIAILKGWDFIGNKRSNGTGTLRTNLAVLETKVETHLEAGIRLHDRIENIENNISQIQQSVAEINGRLTP